MRPTIVLVHGAFAESSSWDQVIDHLLDAGHPVVAVANPLRGLATDTCVSDHVRSIDGPVVLVAHSYSTLGDALQAVTRSDGTTDVTIVQERFHEQFCADVAAPQAARMAATQRPVTQEALVEPSGERPLWKELPSWFVFGEEDRNIPKALEHYMAERARAHRTIEIPGASHAVSVAHPGTTAGLILDAAALHAAA
jgi:pimeloyl-ACP methyl ester carboxylesterase